MFGATSSKPLISILAAVTTDDSGRLRGFVLEESKDARVCSDLCGTFVALHGLRVAGAALRPPPACSLSSHFRSRQTTRSFFRLRCCASSSAGCTLGCFCRSRASARWGRAELHASVVCHAPWVGDAGVGLRRRSRPVRHGDPGTDAGVAGPCAAALAPRSGQCPAGR